MRKDPPYLVGPGWWPMLDSCFRIIYESDPDCKISVRSENGKCLVEYQTDKAEAEKKIALVVRGIENASQDICESCGHPVNKRGCARCKLNEREWT